MTDRTTAQLIRAARYAKSEQIYREIERSYQRIGRGERPDNMYTQAELAEQSGIAQSDISKYERGMVTPGINNLRRLGAALGVSWWKLVAGKVGEKED